MTKSIVYGIWEQKDIWLNWNTIWEVQIMGPETLASGHLQSWYYVCKSVFLWLKIESQRLAIFHFRGKIFRFPKRKFSTYSVLQHLKLRNPTLGMIDMGKRQSANKIREFQLQDPNEKLWCLTYKQILGRIYSKQWQFDTRCCKIFEKQEVFRRNK